jgi:microcompartment protein CcmL/EutN
VEHEQRLGGSLPPRFTEPAIGLVESASIAKGYEIADAVAKVAPVRVLWARTASPGKFVTLFAGDVEAVRSAHARGLEVAGDALEDEMVIPNVHSTLLAAIGGPRRVRMDALGIVETRTVATAVLAADVAAKASVAELVEVRLAMHLGGKGFFTIAGDVGDVEASVAQAAEVARTRGVLIREVVIPKVSQELLEHVF